MITKLCPVFVRSTSTVISTIASVTDKPKLRVRLHVSWWPAVGWKRRLHQWDKLSVSASWKDIHAWTDHHNWLQHLVRTEPSLHSSAMSINFYLVFSHPKKSLTIKLNWKKRLKKKVIEIISERTKTKHRLQMPKQFNSITYNSILSPQLLQWTEVYMFQQCVWWSLHYLWRWPLHFIWW